ncbi:AcrR family transcriptional regulator [Paenibacillus sp. DS2015]
MDKQDRRITKTRLDIKEAFIALMQEKSFNELTVLDITERANINRTTFYKHYLDKFDLLDKYEAEIFKKIEEAMDEVTMNSLKDTLEKQISFLSLIKVYEYFNVERALMKVLLGPNNDISFQEKTSQLLIKRMHERILTQVPLEQLNIPLDILIIYVSSAHIGLIRYWLENNIQQTPKEMAMLLSQIMIEGPFRASGLEYFLE